MTAPRDTNGLSDLAADLMAADDFDAQAAVIAQALGDLGGAYLNIAEAQTAAAMPHWFYSSLPRAVLEAYEADEHWKHDTVFRTAMGHASQVIWQGGVPQDGMPTETDATFDAFVRDSGTSVIVTQTLAVGPLGDKRALSLISDAAPDNVLHPDHLARVYSTLRLALPWADASATADQDRLVHYPSLDLSTRERQAVKLLAGGFKTARIAETMGVAEVTVHKHIRNARQKLGARTREQVVAEAIRGRHITP